MFIINFFKMKTNKIYMTLGIIVITMVIGVATVNVYLAKPNMTANSLSLSNIGSALSDESEGSYTGMPSGGCHQEIITKYESQSGTYLQETWYRKIVNYSCYSDIYIRYCEIGTRVFSCNSNCNSSDVNSVGWSPHTTNVNGRYCN
jgi:hypothetical protein